MTAPDGPNADAFLGGRVWVHQPETGYRAGLDAVLLAASLSADDGDRLAEAGTGAGAAVMCAAARLPWARFSGFERDDAMVALARRGVETNGFSGRVTIDLADIAERKPELENLFDQAFANPPFFNPGEVRPPAAGKESAYLAHTPLRAWGLFLLHVTRPRGRITMIHRAAALANVLELFDPRAGEIEVLPVRPAPGEAASRILVRARKGLRRGPVRLYDGLTLHTSPGGALTERAEAVLGGAELDWR
jgi:tRNA1(Val) A37 N6-methylase TrmN6